MSARGVHGSRFSDNDKVMKCFPDSQRGIANNRCGFGWHFPTVHQKRKKPPEFFPRAISCKGRLVLHQFNFTGNDFEDASFRSISSSVSLHPDATDDTDSSSYLELVQVLDGVALPCDDAEPGSVNDVTAILHVNAPDD